MYVGHAGYHGQPSPGSPTACPLVRDQVHSERLGSLVERMCGVLSSSTILRLNLEAQNPLQISTWVSSEVSPELPAFDAVIKLTFQTSIAAALDTEFVPALSKPSFLFLLLARIKPL